MSTDKNILGELIEKAASSVNLLDVTDSSDLENLQNILDQIKEGIPALNDTSSEIVSQMQQATSDTVGALEAILQKKVDDTTNAADKLSNGVQQLQALIAGLTNPPEESGQSTPTEVVSDEIVIPEEDKPLVLDFITEANEHIESVESGLLELENDSQDSDLLNQIFRGFHTIKGMAGFLNLTEIGTLAHSAENVLDLARKNELQLIDENSNVIFESIDIMKKMIEGLNNALSTNQPIPSQKGIDKLIAKLEAAAKGELLSSNDEKDRRLDEVLEPQDNNEQEKNSKRTNLAGDEKIKVSTSRLDKLVNMVGELVIAQLMVSEQVGSSTDEISRKVAHQSKIVRELQELSLSMRMVPIQGVFQKMARLVRDLSHKADKKINFVTEGEETELDRNIVDKIADPLIHMIRNSVDHGIESSEERDASGKSQTGTIELRASHQSGNIVIEIEDDGKGLDKDKILKKAVEKGLIEPDQKLNDEEIFKLIFSAGFSTAAVITSVSGRGVGMDVVKKNIESLRGKVDISSEKNKGTLFTIRLPLTLAIIDGQTLKVGSERYIIPISSIAHSFRPKPEQVFAVQDKAEMVKVSEELIPLVRLYRLFDIQPLHEDISDSLIVMVQEDEKKCCLLVDELMGQQQVVIKNLGDGLGKIKGVSGGAIMGDGKISLILDIPGLISLAQS
ncbi:MAG: chemotaxis protein CheA [Phycisphaerales bacterium]|jgi:two-component system chemotaxis sensor kinase CheA